MISIEMGLLSRCNMLFFRVRCNELIKKIVRYIPPAETGDREHEHADPSVAGFHIMYSTK